MTIEKMGELLNENYVSPEATDKISKHLKEQTKSNAYDTITDANIFASVITFPKTK